MGREVKPVRRPYERVKMNVRNKSERNGEKLKLIVVHSTESHERPGNADLEAIGAWFDNPKAEASAHVCVDKEGRSARYVTDRMKAWACAAFNSVSLNIEQIGFSSDKRKAWTPEQLDKVAKHLAYWSHKNGIPLRKGLTLGNRVIRSGVVRHSQLGVAGGNHNDPGKDYPLGDVIEKARYYKEHGWA